MSDPSHRKTVTLAEGKVAFKKIITDRHQRLGTDPTADVQRIDAARTAIAMWGEADQILARVAAAPGPMGCCTYTIDQQTFKVVMTQTECNGAPDPHQWTPGPCPP
jgi:hypothetical protein